MFDPQIIHLIKGRGDERSSRENWDTPAGKRNPGAPIMGCAQRPGTSDELLELGAA